MILKLVVRPFGGGDEKQQVVREPEFDLETVYLTGVQRGDGFRRVDCCRGVVERPDRCDRQHTVAELDGVVGVPNSTGTSGASNWHIAAN
ncbi:hypothetical protein ACFYO1_29605 [Nocardia sp. NPDC006044]|uniref:hypothetical protein n=1 Tax=Nocardia sp. NPDC006044 TaxID=3364306 RepID=UPI00369594A2